MQSGQQSKGGKQRRRIQLLALACLLLLTGAAGCGGDDVQRDLPEIRASDTLVVGTRYNSTSYFLYRGAAMGYEYELLRAFAEAEGVELRMVVAPDHEALRELLQRGEIDVIAARLVPEGPLAEHVAFTEPLFTTPRVLVQRTAPPEPQTRTQARALEAAAGEAALPESAMLRVRRITAPAELAGEPVHVGEESGALELLVELSDSIDGTIEIVEVEADVTTESLIRRVAAGQVALTVARQNVAQLQAERYTNIEVRPVLGPPTGLVWAVRPESTALQAALDSWIREQRAGELFANLYRRYYEDRGGYRERMTSAYLTGETGTLSDYDDLIRRHAGTIGWDWRLLASQMYQESLFDPRARSWAGATGLLQLMPATAQEMGVRDPLDPEQNVAGGVRYLQWLEQQWLEDVPDPDERLRFVLASYNVGRGHVQDAQRLAEHHGHDPRRWAHVSWWLLQKSKRDIFSLPVVRYGYARGIEPVTYVQKILDRYAHYRQFVPDAAAPPQDG